MESDQPLGMETRLNFLLSCSAPKLPQGQQESLPTHQSSAFLLEELLQIAANFYS